MSYPYSNVHASTDHLHRGKSLDTRKWVYGCLIVCEDGAFILPVEAQATRENLSASCVRVDWDTVSRCVGLMASKPRQLLYEGDIVANHMGFKQIIIMRDGCAYFRTLLDYVYDEWQGENFYACEKRFVERDDKSVPVTADTIIGNLWDNPELLPSKEE